MYGVTEWVQIYISTGMHQVQSGKEYYDSPAPHEVLNDN